MPRLENNQHELFAQAIVAGHNYSQAFKQAGYVPDRGHASRLAAHGSVRARVQELMGIAADKASMTAADVVRSIEALVHADISKAIVWDGETATLLPSVMLPPEITGAISEVRQTKDGVTIKFHSKSAALEQLAKYHKLYKESSELNVTMTLEDLVRASYKPGDAHSPNEAKKEEA